MALRRRLNTFFLFGVTCLVLIVVVTIVRPSLLRPGTLGFLSDPKQPPQLRLLTFQSLSPKSPSSNGLSSNGLPSNGTSSNSLSSNGVSSNGTFANVRNVGIEPNRSPPSKVLCVNFVGRLGNQLFQYAAVLGLSLKLNRIPVYTPSGELNRALRVPPPTGNRGQMVTRCTRAPAVSEKACCKVDSRLLQLDPDKDFRIAAYSYLQSWKYFEGREDSVRKAMQFRADVQAVADRTISTYRQKYGNTLVGVHIRRGDFLKEKHSSIGYLVATPEYFVKAMKYFREKYRNVTFLVSTDDEKWLRQSVHDTSDVILLKRESPAVDMALLSSLDHVIISVGTYSWWIGFLNRGETVYYKDFIAPGTQIGRQFNPDGSEYIYPTWIPM